MRWFKVEKFLKDILDVIPLAVMAMIAGFVKLLADGKKLTIATVLKSTFMAGFVGAMTGFLLQPLDLPVPALIFVCSMAGHNAGAVLLLYEKKVESYLKKVGAK
jgi:hypothetical protein